MATIVKFDLTVFPSTELLTRFSQLAQRRGVTVTGASAANRAICLALVGAEEAIAEAAQYIAAEAQDVVTAFERLRQGGTEQ